MTLIILEGPNGAGKSTLASALPGRVIHRGPPKTSHLLREYLVEIQRYCPNPLGLDSLVLDRWHLGELVYPKLQVGRESLATRETLAYLQLWLLSRGAVLVHVTADPKRIIRRLRKRGEPVNTALIRSEVDLFWQAFDASPLPQLIVSSTEGVSVEQNAEAVLHAGFMYANGAAHLSSFPTYVGPLRPDILLVGDKRGPDRAGSREFTSAFVPLPHTSGQYLMRALPDELLLSPRVGLVNANEGDNVYRLWHQVNKPAVVALGHKAYDGCVRDGLKDFGAVPHPQYARRFHYSRVIDYGKLIVQVAESKEDMRKWPRST